MFEGAQVHQQVASGGVALGEILGQHFRHDALEFGRHLWIEFG